MNWSPWGVMDSAAPSLSSGLLAQHPPLSGQRTDSYVLGPGALILPCLSLRARSAPSKLSRALLTHGSWAAAASQPVFPKLLPSRRVQGVLGAPRTFPLTNLRKAQLRKPPTGLRMQFFSEPSVCPKPLAVCSREGRKHGIVHRSLDHGSLSTRFQNFPPSTPRPRPSSWWRGRCGTLP